MNYETIHTTISGIITGMGLGFISTADDRVNNYQGSFPVVVMNPPDAPFEPIEDRFSFKYDIGLWFLALKPQDNTYDTIHALVIAQWNNAATFLREYQERTEPEPITKGLISPFHTIKISAHVTCGVYLQFETETIDDLIC